MNTIGLNISSEDMFLKFPWQRFALGILAILLVHGAIFAQSGVSISEDEKTLIIEDAKDSEILAFGKNVIVKQHAKGVFAFGGNVLIEGRVDEDVAVIGGSIIQKEGAFIGGDVIVFGGTYQHEIKQPLRNPEKETIIFAAFEEELRDFALNPTEVFSPSLTWTFLVWRILSVLFWFIVSFVFTTISPGAVSRAVARFQLSAAKTLGIGILGFFLTIIGVVVSLRFLPNYISTIILLMAFLLLMLAYIFGRIALHVSLGKFLQKRFFSEKKSSETAAILVGVVVWTLLLSIPYLWTFNLVILFAAGVGLVLTARSTAGWQRS